MGLNKMDTGGGGGNADVLITIQTQVSNIAKSKQTVQDQIRKLTNDYQKQTSTIKRQMSEIRQDQESTFEGGRQGKRDMLAQKRTELAKLKEDYTKTYSTLNNRVAGFDKRLKKGNQTLKQTRAQLRKTKNEFPSWALSIMFFGQLVIQTMTAIWRSSVRTFQDMAHSIRGTVTGFDKLTAAGTFLGYVVGQALEPIARFLAPIIMGVAKLIQKFEGTFRVLFIVFTIIGGLLTLFGLFGLAVNAIITGFAAFLKAVVILYKGILLLGNLFKASFWAAVATKIKTIATMIWGATVATAKFIAVWAPFIAIAALVVGLGISIGIVWENIVKAIQIRWEQFKNYLDFFTKMVSIGFKQMGNRTRYIFNVIGENIVKAFDWAFTQVINSINAVITAYNRIAAIFGFRKVDPIKFDGFDTSSFVNARKELDAEMAGLVSDSERVTREFVHNWANLKLDVIANRDEAFGKLGDFWGGLWEGTKSFFKGDITNQMDLPEVEYIDESTTLQGDVIINNNIEEMATFDELEKQMQEIISGFKEHKA